MGRGCLECLGTLGFREEIGPRQNRRNSTFPLEAAGNALGSTGEKAGLGSVSVSDLLDFMVMVFVFQL